MHEQPHGWWLTTTFGSRFRTLLLTRHPTEAVTMYNERLRDRLTKGKGSFVTKTSKLLYQRERAQAAVHDDVACPVCAPLRPREGEE